MWTVQKVLDEGTAEPFVARLMLGVLGIRDQVIRSRVIVGPEFEAARTQFDELYQPVLDSMFTMRKATKRIGQVVSAHRLRLVTGEIACIERRSLQISESVDAELQDQLARALNAAARALKGVQKVTRPLGVDVSHLFVKQQNFERRTQELEDGGHHELARYLKLVRSSWSERLIYRRNALEHEGWSLDRARYTLDSAGQVELVEPAIDSEPVTQWAAAMSARTIGFVEDVLVHSFRNALPPHLAIVEIPSAQRDAKSPCRFAVMPASLQGTAPWVLRYDPVGFR